MVTIANWNVRIGTAAFGIRIKSFVGAAVLEEPDFLKRQYVVFHHARSQHFEVASLSIL